MSAKLIKSGMKYTIHLHCEISCQCELEHLTAAAKATLTRVGAPAGGMSLILTGEEQLRTFNREYRGVDLPTDVLSFADGTADADSGQAYFGDVIIAVPIADEQASQYGHSLESELILLTVHGVLHLLGYDHEEPAEKARMWSKQDEILQLLNCDILSPRSTI